ncbi:MAG: alpha-glucosidase [Fluviicoccus sp.]|uniref:alpha-glucosidase n=1 Tax=Fluviicoccus sp. TaxID=2003552 RepID=UPI0027169C52|nr:alpha-glucosidase [Fluviicoccus sp.]MDO8331141.1 alpha-glucosidase [Fluviicoccus sp.]
MKPQYLGWVITLAMCGHEALAANTILRSPSATTGAVGGFNVFWTGSRLQVKSGARIVWESNAGESFVRAGTHAMRAPEGRGSFIVSENIRSQCADQTITSFTQSATDVVVKGRLTGSALCATGYTLSFRQPLAGHLQFTLSFDNAAVNYSELAYASVAGERFHGFGEQFSLLNLKGHAVPVLTQEGGIGRGHPIISPAVSLLSPGSAGGPMTTYYAVPQYITSTAKSLFLEDTEYSVFDLTDSNQVRVRLFSGRMTGRILAGNSMLDLITRFTEYSGRMRALPEWFNQGAIVGLQGGTAKVTAVLDELKRRGTPVAGVWLQDWVGKRTTIAGSQLWWNWELDHNWYPNWNALADRVEADNGHMLCYINPLLVDASAKGNVRRNLYSEAVASGYLVKHTDGSIYKIKGTDFDAGLVDLTNPSATIWFKNIIKTQLMGEGRCRGWMHDFAEALPLDAALWSGVSAGRYHNQYPVDFARIAREAINEAGLGKEAVFFNRAGAARTPAYSTLVWQGDQMVTWDQYDGFKTAILATMTGGFSGIALNHSDIGGYTNASLGGIGYNREQELLQRWMEFAAFTSAYRTHEGLKPEDNAQFYDNATTYGHFDKFAKVYKALAFYRTQLFADVAAKGWPLVRHPVLHYPNEAELATLTDEFLLGSEILMAPVVNKNDYNYGWKKVYFPNKAGTTWVHAFTGYTYGKNSNAPEAPLWLRIANPASGSWQWVYAPLGTPAAFYKQGSTVGAQFETNLRNLGVK